MFSTYGTITDVHVMGGERSSSGQACAFVNYEGKEAAESAIQSLDGIYCIRESGDTPISVSWAKPSSAGAASFGAGAPAAGVVVPASAVIPAWSPVVAPAGPNGGGECGQPPHFDGQHKLFVGNLPSDTSREEIEAVFSAYGVVADVHIMDGTRSASGQSCAFVVYQRQAEAEYAIASLDGVYSARPGLEPITVKLARPPAMQSALPASHSQAFAWGGAGSALGQGGHAGASLMAHRPGVISGLGHVQAPAISSTARAPHAIAPRAAAPRAAVTGAFGVPAPPPPNPSVSMQPSKVFVGNLPADIREEAIHHVFGHYGMVRQVHVMTGRSKSGQSCAFVEYSSPSEAETAILTLHEKYEIRPGEGTILVKWAANSGIRSAPY